MPHIYSKYTIGNTLAIDLRQAAGGPQLDFVSFVSQSDSVDVEIDTSDVSLGTYELVLESFDANSGVYSTLKKDTIQIVVTEPAPSLEEPSGPGESDPDGMKTITAGAGESWRLGLIDDFDQLAEVRVQYSPPNLATYLDFDADKRVFTYNGKEGISQFSNSFSQIKVVLVDALGVETQSMVTLKILALADQQHQTEPSK